MANRRKVTSEVADAHERSKDFLDPIRNGAPARGGKGGRHGARDHALLLHHVPPRLAGQRRPSASSSTTVNLKEARASGSSA